MQTLKIPTIHLNGTSKEALLENYSNAICVLHDAVKALRETAPNARDYYPQGAGQYEIAQSEHTARLYSLNKISTELQMIAEAL